MNHPLPFPATHPTRLTTPFLWPALTALLLTSLSSCIQPPPPRTYNPQVSRHLRKLSHDTPVTPIPCTWDGWGYYGYAYGCGY